jgi:hypothetical protein
MMLIAFGGGNLSGSQAFQAADAPTYLPGTPFSSPLPATPAHFSILAGKLGLLVLLCTLVPGCLFMHFYVGRLNQAKARRIAELTAGWTAEDVQREKDRLFVLFATKADLLLFAGSRI